MNIKRVALDIALFAAVLFAPWWATTALGVALLFLFSTFIEFIAAGILLDVLYSTGKFYFTAGAIVVYAIAMFLKRYIRYYD